MKAGFSLEEAKIQEADIKKLNPHWVMSQCLHMLFVVAPLECSVKPDNKHFNDIFMHLESTLLHTAQVIGITESLAMKLVTRPTAISESDYVLIKRFYIALMLYDLYKNVYEVAKTYNVERGVASSLMASASARAYSIFKFCEVFEEFTFLKDVLEKFSTRLLYHCSDELLPLMELPSVKIVS